MQYEAIANDNSSATHLRYASFFFCAFFCSLLIPGEQLPRQIHFSLGYGAPWSHINRLVASFQTAGYSKMSRSCRTVRHIPFHSIGQSHSAPSSETLVARCPMAKGHALVVLARCRKVFPGLQTHATALDSVAIGCETGACLPSNAQAPANDPNRWSRSYSCGRR